MQYARNYYIGQYGSAPLNQSLRYDQNATSMRAPGYMPLQQPQVIYPGRQ
jgi:hypothetical protein